MKKKNKKNNNNNNSNNKHNTRKINLLNTNSILTKNQQIMKGLKRFTHIRYENSH